MDTCHTTEPAAVIETVQAAQCIQRDGRGSLYMWLQQHECCLQSTKKKGGKSKSTTAANTTETHLLLDGGRLAIPDALNNDFLKQYAACVDAGEWLYVVEKKTETFKYFCELDYRTASVPLTSEHVFQIAYFVQHMVVGPLMMHLPKGRLKLVVSWAPTVFEKMSKDGTERIYKTGIHLNWPHLPVTLETARCIRVKALEMAKILACTPDADRRFPLPSESWSDVFDASVYRQCGLRLIYSRKSAKCPSCDGIPFQLKQVLKGTKAGPLTKLQLDPGERMWACQLCNGNGKVDLGRPYKVLHCINDDGTPDLELLMRYTMHMLSAVRDLSIRVTDATCAPCEIAPQTGAAELERLHDVVAKDKFYKSGRPGVTVCRPENDTVPPECVHSTMMSRRPNGSYSELPMERVAMESQQAAIICALVRASYSFAPTVVDIKRIKPPSRMKKTKPIPADEDAATTSGGDGTCTPPPTEAHGATATPDPSRVATFYIADTRDHYCLNKGGEHSHSHVYFIITMDGLYQKCFCRKGDTYRAGGVSCADYRSPSIKIPGSTLKVLFSQYAKRQAKRIHNRCALLDMLHGPQCRAGAPGAPAAATASPPQDVQPDDTEPVPNGDAAADTPVTKQHPPPTKRRRLQKGGESGTNERAPHRGRGRGDGTKKPTESPPALPHAPAAGAYGDDGRCNVFRKALLENKSIRGRTRF